MNCYNHPARPAVAQCVDCHKGLCSSCARKYTIPICDECNNKMRGVELRLRTAALLESTDDFISNTEKILE